MTSLFLSRTRPAQQTLEMRMIDWSAMATAVLHATAEMRVVIGGNRSDEKACGHELAIIENRED
jgi:hypothetical protein